jgi:hypothetical protein
MMPGELDLVRQKYSKLWAGLVTVQPVLNQPYPDDPRWTPWTRFVAPRMEMLLAALDGEDIDELEGMRRVAIKSGDGNA